MGRPGKWFGGRWQTALATSASTNETRSNEMTEVKNIPLTEETQVDRTPGRQLGPQILHLPEGEALCTDADSLTTIVAVDGDGVGFVMVIAVASHEGLRLGSLSPMTPTQARSFAVSLVAAADQVDAKVGVN